MKISIPDDYQQAVATLDCFNLIKDHNVTIIHDHFTDERQLARALNDPEVLILTRTRTRITDSLLIMLPNLKIISQTGKNAGHIDIEACHRHNVVVLEGRGDPTATAELTWSLIMNALRLLPQAIIGMKRGLWQTNIGRRVKGKTIGIWGYGRIGQLVAVYAKTFGAQVLIWGSAKSRSQAVSDGYISCSNKSEFFSHCDVISLHLRLTETTRGVVTKSDLMMMKSDALLVNTARAELIKKGALLKCLEMGHPGYAAIDVFDDEPIFDSSHPLLKMPNVICTPHLGYVEKQSYELYYRLAFENILKYLDQQ